MQNQKYRHWCNIKSCRGISANKLFSCPRFYHIKKFYQTVIKISKNSHTFTIEITLPERRSIYTVAFQENSGWQVSFLSCRSATFILFMKFKTGLNYSIYWNINWIISDLTSNLIILDIYYKWWVLFIFVHWSVFYSLSPLSWLLFPWMQLLFSHLQCTLSMWI